MDEVLEQNEVAEVVPHETTQEETIQQEAPQQDVDPRQERNWKELNRAKRELEKELRLQREMNERLLQMQPKIQNLPEADELDAIAESDYLQKGQNKKLVQKELNPLKKEIEDLKKDLHFQKQKDLVNSLSRKYSDFNDVVTHETLALLEEQEPELAEAIASSQDPYKIGVQSYKYIKALGLSDKVPDSRRLKEVEKQLDKNSKTVQTPQAYEKRPMAEAFRMTESDKTKLYQEMMGYAQQAGGSY